MSGNVPYVIGILSGAITYLLLRICASGSQKGRTVVIDKEGEAWDISGAKPVKTRIPEGAKKIWFSNTIM